MEGLSETDSEAIARSLYQDEESYIKYVSSHGYELSGDQLLMVVKSVQEGARLARRLEMEPAMLAALDTEDLKVLDWFRDYYRTHRQELSDKNRAITGLPFPISDPLYIPAAVEFNKDTMNGYSVYMPLVPPSLSPRVFNLRDVDEQANIFEFICAACRAISSLSILPRFIKRCNVSLMILS